MFSLLLIRFQDSHVKMPTVPFSSISWSKCQLYSTCSNLKIVYLFNYYIIQLLFSWNSYILVDFLQRENAVDNFRAGKTWVLIATDVIARGMDFKGVNCVINYDFPDSAAAYVHRIGQSLNYFYITVSLQIVYLESHFNFIQVLFFFLGYNILLMFLNFHGFKIFLAPQDIFIFLMILIKQTHSWQVFAQPHLKLFLLWILIRSNGQGRQEWRSYYLVH